MSLWTWIVLIFVSLNYISYVVKIFLATKREQVWKTVIKTVVIPVIFPYLLFVYALVGFRGAYLPAFAALSVVPSFWTVMLIVTLVGSVLSLVIYYFRSDKMLTLVDPDVRRSAAHNNNLFTSTLVSTTAISLGIGVTEEIVFRLVFFVSLQPLAYLFLKLAWVTQLLALIPSWLSLEFVAIVPGYVFLAALVSNAIFAWLHREFNGDKNLWHRVIFAWFGGWVYFFGVYYFGLLGAVLIHALDDIVILTLPIYFLMKKAAVTYWKDRYGD